MMCSRCDKQNSAGEKCSDQTLIAKLCRSSSIWQIEGKIKSMKMDWNGETRFAETRLSGWWIFVYNMKFIHLEKSAFCLCLSWKDTFLFDFHYGFFSGNRKKSIHVCDVAQRPGAAMMSMLTLSASLNMTSACRTFVNSRGFGHHDVICRASHNRVVFIQNRIFIFFHSLSHHKASSPRQNNNDDKNIMKRTFFRRKINFLTMNAGEKSGQNYFVLLKQERFASLIWKSTLRCTRLALWSVNRVFIIIIPHATQIVE